MHVGQHTEEKKKDANHTSGIQEHRIYKYRVRDLMTNTSPGALYF